MDIEMNATDAIDNLLRSYPSLQRIVDKDRVKCNWTGHEMPARFEVIQKYIQGKRYQQYLKKMNDLNSLDMFRDFLEPSKKKNHENQFFCKLTWRHINKEPHHIKKHIEGKRFKRAYAQWQKCQANGTEYAPLALKKKNKQNGNGNENDDDQYVDLSDDEIVVENDEDDDLSDLYPDFRRLRASDGQQLTKKSEEKQEEENGTGTKRKAEKSQMKKPKKLAAPSSKRMRSSDETTSNGDVLVKPTKTMTLTI